MSLIYLIGARGSGKTTVGCKLAELLNCGFIDLDAHLRARENKSVEDIVRESGWPQFRAIESECLVEATGLFAGKNGGVIATGGGIVLLEKNRQFLRDNGKVFWLKGNAGVLRARLENDPGLQQRPSLTGQGLLDEIEDILKEREPLYLACAHKSFEAAENPEQICGRIMECL